MEEDQRQINNPIIKFWQQFFQFMSNRTTIISSFSLCSLILLLIVLFIVLKKNPVPKINNVRSAFSSMTYDLCEL